LQKNTSSHARDCGEAIGSRLSLGNAINVRDVHEAANLLAQRLHQTRVIVAQRIYRYSGEGIQVGLALLVEHPATLPVGKGHRQAPVGIHQMRHACTPRKHGSSVG
jgi:hypothetical protein